MMMVVPLYGKRAVGRVALVDDQDYELVMRYRWHVQEDWTRSPRPSGPYAVTHMWQDGQSRALMMHTLITGLRRTDHKNHNGLDNRRENLRDGGGSLNNANTRPWPGCASPYKGVSWVNDRQRWTARIRINGKLFRLGRYLDEQDAARVYDAAALAAWGEYAWLNFPVPRPESG